MKVILLLCLALVSCNNLRGLADSTILNTMLSQHNTYRKAHGAANLSIVTAIQTMAQNYANTLASTNTFTHSQSSNRLYSGKSTGENLYKCWTSSSAGCIGTGVKPVDTWYEDKENYDASNPQPSHFTQLVWKATKNVGCGYANGRDGTWYTTTVVCNYYPAGNVKGSYPSNVQL